MPTIKAIYENGVFRPQEPVDAPEGMVVDIALGAAVRETDEEVMERRRARYPNSIGVLSKQAADELEELIEAEFERVDPDGWA